ncbi:CHAT domain-containing protein [Candidatus Uabimicrobium amorphum]|uniref:CHAT domain-containing protein n=1 Tax=Uabimicrobium amorphum TaxID=2596890 RepID=A0A5S9IX08_UABAM|nr:CHAT domain-containing protein [Candidatus Uabimicrobium amorphum]BBM88075.1 hypothetical protein UABAM_06491 [Candidatus Uabimicrobium amorphum]
MRWEIFILVFCLVLNIEAQNNTKINELQKTHNWYQQHYEKGAYAKASPYAEKIYALSKEIFGKSHPDTLTALNNLAGLYCHQGKYNQARPLLTKCLKLQRKNLGDSHPDTLQSLNNLGMLYYKQGKYDKAQSLLTKCLKLRRKNLGDSHPHTLVSLDSLGVLYEKQGKYHKAETFLVTCFELSQKHLGNSHQSTLLSLNNLGALYYKQGKYHKAETSYLQCWKLRKETLGEAHPHTLASLNNLGMLYETQGKYSKAEHLYLRCLKLMQETQGDSHPNTLTALNNLGILYKQQGRYDKAEPIYIRCLQLIKETLGHSHPYTIKSLNNLGMLYDTQGRYDKAEPLLLQCLELSQKTQGDAHPDTLTALNNLGMLYKRQLRYNKAEPFLLKCLKRTREKLKETHPHTLSSMNNLGVLYRLQGKYDKALPLLLKSLEFMQQKFGNTHPNTLLSLNDLGMLYHSKGKYDKAEAIYIRCLQLMKEALGDSHPNTLQVLNNLAVLYKSSKRYNQAQSLFLKYIKLSKEKLGDSHPDVVGSLSNLGLLYYNQRKYEQAQNILQKWFDKRNDSLHDLLLATDKKTQSHYLKQDKYVNEVLLSLYLQKNDTASLQKIVNYSLNRKGILLHFSPDTLSHTQRKDKKIQQAFRKLQSERSTLSQLIINPPQNISAQQLQTNISTLRNEIEKKEGMVARLNHNFRRASRKITVKSLQQKLKPQEIIIDFLVMQIKNLDNKKSRQLLATITTKSEVYLVRFGEFSTIKKSIQDYRKKILNSETKPNKIAKKIYKKIWQPLQKYCKNYQTIYVIPDGELHLLPLQAMVDENNRYVLETHNIQMITSARYLSYTTDDYGVAMDNPTIFASPNYKNPNTTQKRNPHFGDIYFSPLPGTKKEGLALAEMLKTKQKTAVVYLENEANKKNLRKVIAPRFLHIATHGFFLKTQSTAKNGSRGIGTLEKQPVIALPNHKTQPSTSTTPTNLAKAENPLLYCGLALSDANIDQLQGIVTAMEVSSLNLSGTELVTLSACNTSEGEVVSGDGVYSLRRAFQEAGAKVVLSSLWAASDKATLYLMKKFYHHYLNNATPQSALRIAQLECIAEGRYAHPRYWANFVMLGSDRLFPNRRVLKVIPVKRNPLHMYLWIFVMVVFASIVVGWLIILRKQKAQRETLRRERQQRRQRK